MADECAIWIPPTGHCVSSDHREQVANKFSSPAHAGEMFTDILQEYTVRDMLDRVRWVEPVPEDMSFRRFKRLFTSTDQHYFPVLDDKGGLAGIFSANDVRAILLQPHMDDLINMRDLARTDIIKVTPREDLGSVMRKLTQRNLDALPVVRQDDPQALLGMLGRREAIAFYNEKMAELRKEEED